MEKPNILEIKKITIAAENLFNPEFYPESGIFHVHFENGGNPDVMFINRELNTAAYLGSAIGFFTNVQMIKEEPAPPITFKSVTVPEQSEPIKTEPAFTPDFILELSRILTREKDHKNRFTNP